MKRSLLLLLALPTLWAARNLTTTLTGSGQTSFTPGIPVTLTNKIIIEMAYDHFSVAASSTPIFGVGPSSGNPFFYFRLQGTSLELINYWDTNNSIPSIDITGWQQEVNDYGLSAVGIRDGAAATTTLRVCRMDGTHCVQSVASNTTGTHTINGAAIGRAGQGAGNNGIYGQLAVAKISVDVDYAPQVPPNAHNAQIGNKGDWTFEDSLTNSVTGIAWDLDWGAPSYTASTPHLPVCGAGPQKTFRAGASAATLDGTQSYALDYNTVSLAFKWAQTSGPSVATWNSHDTQNPSLTGLVFGSYVLALTVRDGSGNTATCSVKHGAVATDAHGNSIITDPVANRYFGSQGGVPAIITDQAPQAGVNQYPWYYRQVRLTADGIVNHVHTDFPAKWNQPLAGTISTINTCNGPADENGTACRTVTGVGTDFMHDFCADGTVPYQKAYIVIWYNSTIVGNGTSDGKGRRRQPVGSCTDATHLELGTNWITTGSNGVGPGQTGMGYARVYMDIDPITGPEHERAETSWWDDSSANAAYYEAFSGVLWMYYATGIDDYLVGFHDLVDAWFTHSIIDSGGPMVFEEHLNNCCKGGFGNGTRNVGSFMAMIIRASEPGMSWMWPGIRRIADYYDAQDGGTGAGGIMTDLRETGFSLEQIALMAVFDPDVTSRAHFWSSVQGRLNTIWIPHTAQAGTWTYWLSYPGSFVWGGYTFGCCNLSYTGTATVTTGSPDVTGVGTNFAADTGTIACVGGFIQFFDTGLTATYDANSWKNLGDAAAYRVSSATNTTLTLLRPYQGTGGQKQYGCIQDAGFEQYQGGVQPFMLALGAGGGMWWSRQAALDNGNTTLAATLAGYVKGIGHAWMDHWYAADGGMDYWFISPNCETTVKSDVAAFCASINGPVGGNPLADDEGRRINTSEGILAAIRLYALDPQPATATFIDTAMCNIYGKPNENGACTGLYILSMQQFWWAPGYQQNARISKWFGFIAGKGASWTWWSIRPGTGDGLAPADLRTINISTPISDGPGATQIRVTVRGPANATAVQTVCSALPCAATTPDARQGDHLVKIEWLNAGNTVVRTSSEMTLRVQ
jgi:hypothetical protein